MHIFPFKKPIILFLYLLIFSCCTNTTAVDKEEFVSIEGKNFKLKNSSFYPITLNYSTTLNFNGSEFWVSPSKGYGDKDIGTKDRGTKKFRADMQLIKDMGFNTVRIIGGNEYGVDENKVFVSVDNNGKENKVFKFGMIKQSKKNKKLKTTPYCYEGRYEKLEKPTVVTIKTKDSNEVKTITHNFRPVVKMLRAEECPELTKHEYFSKLTVRKEKQEAEKKKQLKKEREAKKVKDAEASGKPLPKKSKRVKRAVRVKKSTTECTGSSCPVTTTTTSTVTATPVSTSVSTSVTAGPAPPAVSATKTVSKPRGKKSSTSVDSTVVSTPATVVAPTPAAVPVPTTSTSAVPTPKKGGRKATKA